MNTDSRQTVPDTKALETAEKKENVPGPGFKIATVSVLLLASAMSLIKPLLSSHENTPYWIGTLVGAAFAPLLICGVIIALFSIFKSFRNAGSRYGIALIVGALLLMTQCTAAIRAIGNAGRNARTPIPIAATTPLPLGPEDIAAVEAACREFEQGIQQGDVSAFSKRFDRQLLFNRAAAGLTIPASLLEGVEKGMLKPDPVTLLTAPTVLSITDGKGEVALLRIRALDTEARALFRVRMDGGLNYNEWIFQKTDERPPRVVDVHVLSSGEPFSEVLRRTALAPLQGGLPDKAVDEKLAFYEKIKSITEAAGHGRPEEAKQIFDSMSKTEQDHKLTMTAYITAAAELPDEIYTEAMERYMALFPNDPGLLLLSVDYHILKENYAEAVRQLSRLNAVVRDPVVDTMIADILFTDKAYAESEAAARRAVEGGDTSEEARWSLLNALVYQEKFAEAIPVVDALKADFDAEVDPRAEDAAYRAFAVSKPFKKWKRTAAQRPARRQEAE